MPFSVGETILTSDPFAHAVKLDLRESMCDNCVERIEGDAPRKCTGCKAVSYCSRDCQLAAWKAYHKQECPRIARLPRPRQMPDTPMLLARIVIRLRKEKGSPPSGETMPDGRVKRYDDLMSHVEDIKKDKKRTEHYAECCLALSDFFQDDIFQNNPELLLAAYGKATINGFNILDYDISPVGLGLYLSASAMDHSCSPNAAVVFLGKRLLLRATYPVERFEKVRINYVDPTDDRDTRRAKLSSLYYFDCECITCRSDPVGSHRDADRPSSPEDPASLAEYKRLKAKVKQAMKHTAYEEMEWLPLYNSMKKHFLPEDPIFRVVVIGAIKKALLSGKQELAFDLTKISLPVLKVVLPEFDVVTGTNYLQAAIIAMELDHLDTALEYLTEARRILSVTHGPSHPMVCKYTAGFLAQCRALIQAKRFCR